jgi:hypothetical protein
MRGVKRLSEPEGGGGWVEIRDEGGRLYARLDGDRLLLELGRNGGWVVVDLRVYCEILRGLENGRDME